MDILTRINVQYLVVGLNKNNQHTSTIMTLLILAGVNAKATHRVYLLSVRYLTYFIDFVPTSTSHGLSFLSSSTSKPRISKQALPRL